MIYINKEILPFFYSSEFSEASCVAFKYGMVSFKIPGRPFKQKSGTFNQRSFERACLFGKLFILRVFEEMDKLGYTFLVSSDLTRTVDNGTLLFRKSPRVPVSRPWRKCLCIAPLDSDKLVLVRCPENAHEAPTECLQFVRRLSIECP